MEEKRSVHLSRKDGLGRMPADFYKTDRETVERCLQRMKTHALYHPPERILDLGAGTGIWGEVAREIWPSAWIGAVEIRDVPPHSAYDWWQQASFPECLPANVEPSIDMIIGNPPYNRAEQFVREGWRLLRKDGSLGFLLRLAFLEGQGRRDGLFCELPLSEVNVCSKRPSYQEDGRTNATAFAFFVWEDGYYAAPTIHFM